MLSELRQKESPKLLKRYQKFVVDIVKAANPDSRKKSTKLMINKLCELMEEGLVLVALQEQELKQKSKEIRKVLHQINGLSKTNKHLSYIDPAEILKLSKEFNKQSSVGAYMKDQADPTVAPDELDDTEDEFHQAASAVKVEDWLEFYSDKGTKRLKVSWISPISGKLLFVNGKGGREFDLFRLELAEKFRNNECQSLQQLPLIDRAMQSIANKLETKTDTTETQ